jgi:hypothetical protein
MESVSRTDDEDLSCEEGIRQSFPASMMHTERTIPAEIRICTGPGLNAEVASRA